MTSINSVTSSQACNDRPQVLIGAVDDTPINLIGLSANLQMFNKKNRINFIYHIKTLDTTHNPPQEIETETLVKNGPDAQKMILAAEKSRRPFDIWLWDQQLSLGEPFGSEIAFDTHHQIASLGTERRTPLSSPGCVSSLSESVRSLSVPLSLEQSLGQLAISSTSTPSYPLNNSTSSPLSARSTVLSPLPISGNLSEGEIRPIHPMPISAILLPSAAAAASASTVMQSTAAAASASVAPVSSTLAAETEQIIQGLTNLQSDYPDIFYMAYKPSDIRNQQIPLPISIAFSTDRVTLSTDEPSKKAADHNIRFGIIKTPPTIKRAIELIAKLAVLYGAYRIPAADSAPLPVQH